MKEWIKKNRSILMILLIHLLMTETFWGIKNQGKSIENILHVRKSIIGGMYDQVVVSFFAGLFGAIFIYLFWNMIFKIVKEKKISYVVIMIIALAVNLYIYPKQFYFFETDNAVIYKQAVFNHADYWQGLFMTCIYKACMLVLPLPIMIPVIQTVFLLTILWYLFGRMKKIWGNKAYLFGILFLFPEIYEIGINPYRNCMNALVCIALYGVLFLDVIEKKKRDVNQLMCAGAVVAFLSVFRSEGMIHLVVYIVACVTVYQVNRKQWLWCGCVLIGFLLLFGLPQKIGRSQYFEKEYSIVNYMQVLQDIFNSEECNLTYEGANQDIELLSKAVPYDMVKKIGLVGFRYHNYENGRNINQSDLTKEKQKEALNAIYRILLHNPKMMFGSKFAEFCSANGMNVRGTMGAYLEGDVDKMDEEILFDAEKGIEKVKEDSYGIIKCRDIDNDPIALKFLQKIQEKAGVIYFYIKLITFLLFGLLALYYAGKYNKEQLLFCATAVALLYAQLIGIILLSPEGRNGYYYPLFFVMFLGSIALMLETTKYEKLSKSRSSAKKDL